MYLIRYKYNESFDINKKNIANSKTFVYVCMYNMKNIIVMKTERIKAELKLLGITREDFAKAIGLKLSSLDSVLNRGTTSISTLKLICKELNVSSDYILGLKDTK